MRNVLGWLWFAVLTLGCGIEKETDDMALPKYPVSWALTGGLDTKKSPLAIQPGSHLTLDNVIQERLNEWRRRNGFTQVALDTLPEAAPYFIGRLGDSGLFENGRAGLSAYFPSYTSGKWGAQALVAPPQHRTRRPIVESPSWQGIGFAAMGNAALTQSLAAPYSQTVLLDRLSGATKASLTDPTVTLARGAASTSKLFMFNMFGGNLWWNSFDPTTGASAAGAFGGSPLFTRLDAMWYGGATITIVGATAAGAVSFMEFNTTSVTLTTNVVLAGVLADSSLSLLADPDQSGVRFVATSGTTPTTRVIRCSSAGAILSNDQAEAVASSYITGVGLTAGAEWNIIYETAANALRVQNKTAGVVGAASAFLGSATWGTSGRIDSQAWREPNIPGVWFVLLGMHSQVTDDPQDTWIEMMLPSGVATGGVAVSNPVPLAAGSKITDGQLRQVTRTAPYKFSYALPVQVVYENNAGTIVRHYSLDLFEQTYLTSADDTITPTQKPIQYKQTAFVPAGQLSFYDQGALKPLGTRVPPRQLTAVGSVAAGALTPLAEYGGVVVVEGIDGDGNIWRSPRSVPLLLTLTGAQNTITWTFPSWGLEPSTYYRVSFYRTAANGSSYRRIYSTLAIAGPDVVYVDLLADTAIVNGEVLYTQGELSTALTPPASVVWFHDDRMFAVNREYPTELWYTKNLRPGRQPEFTNEGIVDVDDEYGDVTNGASLDAQNVLFKRNAIYFGVGDGYTDSGSGSNYRFDRIDGDQGALPGSPIVNTGKVIYFVGERGIHTVDKQGNIVFQDQIDQYLNQPLVQTRETVYDGCFVSTTNDVVFLTTNYLLVHNLTFGYWRRVTGLAGMRRCLVVAGRLVLFRNDGTVWREGDHTQLTDQGTAFEGEIRSPWMRPANGAGGPGTNSTATAGQQGMRMYRGRVTYTRTAGGGTATLRGHVYRNNDDAQVEEFTSGGVQGSRLSGTGEMVPKESKCTSFSLGLVLPSNDVTLRVDGFSAIVGTRQGAQVTDRGDRWQ